jgi:two-component system, cell cycle response regulator DivK
MIPTAGADGKSQGDGVSDGRRVGQRILMVEDDADNLNVYKLMLQHHGFEVIEARTGTEGLERARAHRPDLILLDISIPEVDGWEVTRILKEEENTRSIPILIVTAHGFAGYRARAEKLGCVGLLLKPVAPSRMVQEVTLRLSGEISFNYH